MSVHHWVQREIRWALKNVEDGCLLGSRAGGPILAKTRAEARAIAKLNKCAPGEVAAIKVRISFEEVTQ